MSRWILPNLGFEYELAGRALPKGVAAQEHRFRHILRLLPDFDSAARLLAAASSGDEVVCWGASQTARKLAAQAADSWPSLAVVRLVNDKCFSFQIETELGVESPGAFIASSVDELRHGIAGLGSWVAKHPFGVAGRERVRGDGWDEPAERAVLRLFETAGQLVVEPWAKVEEEISLHFEVTAQQVDYVGAVALLADSHGTFRGNHTRIDVPGPLRDCAEEAAWRVCRAGYHGPIGIDAFRGNLDGPFARPIVEINARWTFGRLTLELGRRLGRDVAWHHPPKGATPAGLKAVGDRAEPGSWLLPDWCDPAGSSGTWIEVFGYA